MAIAGFEDVFYNPLFGKQGMLLLQACAFGDRFVLPKLQELVHNIFVNSTAKLHNVIESEHIGFAFDTLPADDPMLTYLVDKTWMDRIPEGQIVHEEKYLKPLPHHFLTRLVRAYQEKASGRRIWKDVEKKCKIGGCKYHMHRDDLERKKCPYHEKNFLYVTPE